MIYIISGTNRPNSLTLQVAHFLKGKYDEKNIRAEIMNLETLNDSPVKGAYHTEKISPLKEMVEKLNAARGFHVVIPEYNGGMPGVLKYFIDYFSYPKTFEWRPVCFVGLGGRFGGLRPVEHAQQVFGYRNAFIFPQRIFIQSAPKVISNNIVNDAECAKLLNSQVDGFNTFISALESKKLDANSKV